MPDPPTALIVALTDHYRLKRELGSGGMATVYLAEDLKHERHVALKVLKPELAAAIGSERFLREIKITAGLSHPHILPLLDSGEADGFLFYVMPYVEGESLADRLEREKQLPLDDALEIAREVSDALSYAHSHGVIHRDIKPDNILLQSGHAVVADFGIGRAVDAAGGGNLTETGMVIGTPRYMSPEQASGSTELDGRSDLYSLGCVLFEMLGGQPPFTGPTVESLVHQHIAVDPPSITNLRPAVPVEIAGALARALSKTPADRFNPVAQFSHALRVPSSGTGTAAAPASRRRAPLVTGISIVAAVAIVTGGVVTVMNRGSRANAPAAVADDDVPSVAVLPFVDLSGGESEYLGDGMAETLINALSRLDGLRVAARTSAFSFKGRNEDVRSIGDQLGVGAVLEGSVQRAGERIRVTAQLINTSDGFHLWSENFDRDLSDVFAVQDEVARAVVNALQSELLEDPAQPVVQQGTESLAAYNAYLQGRFFWNKRTAADLVRAASFFDDAIAADSNFARAWAGLADTYMLFLPSEYDVQTIPWRKALARGERAARRALEIDDGLAEAHTALAAILEKRYAFDDAEREYRAALELNPRYATARQWYATLLVKLGRAEEGLREIRRAAELDPLSVVIAVEVAELLDVLDRTEEATAHYERLVQLYPDWLLTQWFAGVHFLVQGDFDRASGLLEQFVYGWYQDSVAGRRLAVGLRDPARREQTLRAMADTTKRLEFAVAAYRAVGDPEAVVATIDRSVDGPDAEYIYLPHLLATLGPELRADPRVQAALRRWMSR